MINMYDNKVYRKILEHRRNCPKWTKEFCMDCFGGGLTRFLSNMEEEKLKVDKRFTNVKDAVEYMSKNKNKVIIVDEAGTVALNGKEAMGMSCMGMSISDYINHKNKKQ